MVLNISCKKHYYPVRPVNYSLYLKFEMNGKVPPDSMLSQISLSYNTGSCFRNVPDFIPAINAFADSGIVTTLGNLSAVKHIKDYILSYPDGQADTLFIDFEKVSVEEAYEEPCFCRVPL